MMSEPRCECNDEWMVCIPEVPEVTDLAYEYLMYQSPITPPHRCRVCGYWVWNDAYIEDMYRDLKEMNQ